MHARSEESIFEYIQIPFRIFPVILHQVTQADIGIPEYQTF